MKLSTTKTLMTLGAIAALAVPGTAQARNGADDPAGHARHGVAERCHHHGKKCRKHRAHRLRVRHHARHGADDTARPVRGGTDDRLTGARRRADDPITDTRNGTDDGPNHT